MIRRAVFVGDPIDDPFNQRAPANSSTNSSPNAFATATTGGPVRLVSNQQTSGPPALQPPQTNRRPQPTASAPAELPQATRQNKVSNEPKRIPRSPLPLTAAETNRSSQGVRVAELPTVPPPAPPAATKRYSSRANFQQGNNEQGNSQEGTNPAQGGVAPHLKKYADCKRVYNRRNCCAEDGLCKHAHRLLAANPLEKISLNITPSIRPSAMNKEEEEQYREKGLKDAGARVFRDPQGNVLAEGKMIDFRYENVWIQSADGKITRIPIAQLGDDEACFVTAWWGIPTDCRLATNTRSRTAPHPITMTWTASATCNKPLYFEERALERYGHTAGPFAQPALSAAHFVWNIASLPYQMGINPPQECRYPLGYYRPGDCAPWLLRPFPLSVRGAMTQAAVITGGVNIFP